LRDIVNELEDVKAMAIDFDGVITYLDMNYAFLRNKASELSGRRVRTLTEFFAKFFSTDEFWKVSNMVKQYELKAVENAPLNPEAIELIENAYRKNISIYLTTAQSREPVEIFLERYRLRNFFKDLLTREEYGSKRAMYLRIINDEGLSPEEVAVIDDMEINIVQCKEIGMRCFHVDRYMFSK